MYERLSSQPNRLGEFAGEATGVLNAIGNAITGVITAIEQSKVMRALSKDQRAVAATTAIETTKQLEIATRGAVQQAAIGVENVKATYGSITKLIIGAGVVFSGVLISAAFSYKVASGDQGEYEIAYK